MDYQVVLSEAFLHDLKAIVDHIGNNNPAAAAKVGAVLILACERLASFPLRHPRVRGYPTLRRVIVMRQFKIFYQVDASQQRVDVLRCWDGRRGHDPRFV